MAKPTVTFKCGHSEAFERGVASPPSCRVCGERIVARVSGATPTFTGACRGPLVKQGQP